MGLYFHTLALGPGTFIQVFLLLVIIQACIFPQAAEEKTTRWLDSDQVHLLHGHLCLHRVATVSRHRHHSLQVPSPHHHVSLLETNLSLSPSKPPHEGPAQLCHSPVPGSHFLLCSTPLAPWKVPAGNSLDTALPILVTNLTDAGPARSRNTSPLCKGPQRYKAAKVMFANDKNLMGAAKMAQSVKCPASKGT